MSSSAIMTDAGTNININIDVSSTTTETTTTPFFDSLKDDLLLHVASYLTARELLRYESVSNELYSLHNNIYYESIWKRLCEQRWEPWPQYRLTEERKRDELLLNNTTNNNTTTKWKQRYLTVEQDATRNTLQPSDLRNLNWYLSFILTGVRGEGLSDLVSVEFQFDDTNTTTTNSVLLVPGYYTLPFEIVNESPPSSGNRIRQNLRGDRPFSTTQYVQISDFPPHFITRKRSNAEWLIVNANVIIVSNSSSSSGGSAV